MNRHTALKLMAASLLAAATPLLHAQAYPTKPVRLVVPFAPGGTTDIVARVMAERLQKELGQPVIVDNRAGAGGVLGANEIAKAAPDGYTIGMATVSTTAAAPAINPKTPYDPVRDFTPIVNIAATPNVVAVHPTFKARNYAGFVAELKTHPGRHSYGTAGTGSIGHLQMELFKSLASLYLTHIPYKGSGPALNDAVAGTVPIVFDNLPSALPFIKDGRLIPIVVSSAGRTPQLPNVPTFQEVGLERANRMAYYGLHGPKALPADVVQKLNAAVRKSLADPAVKARIEATGSVIVGNSPEEFGRQVAAEYEVYRRTVSDQKLALD
jgi:tripartite-type tricarboxylate transporter receptor subunit TctC